MVDSAPAGSGRRAPTVVVGRTDEEEILEAALLSGAHVLLEGPPGTGKSTLLRRVAEDRQLPFVLVEGNAELTPARLIGNFDPALVLSRGYSPEIFSDGPLLEAMRTGALLYVEELNRIPEETLNVLLAAMSEREITVPRLGRVQAADGFGLVAAMNPFDAVGTARVSSALYDRTCRIAMGYQSDQVEQQIVGLRAAELDPAWRAQVVQLVRLTRSHRDIEFGSSVRGAIDVARLAVELARMRGTDVRDWHVGLVAAKASLSGRIRPHETAGRTREEIVTELYVSVFGAEPDDAESGEGMPGEQLSPPPGAGAHSPESPSPRGPQKAPRTTGRSELARNARFAELSPEVGELDVDSLNVALADDADDTLTLLVEMARATDEELRDAVRRLAPRLIIDQTRRGLPRGRGVARRRRVPAWRGGEIDLDRSMDAVLEAGSERRLPHVDDLSATDWARPELALCLVIDRSGSMNGPRLTTAAVAGAACLTRAPQEHAVLAFAASVTVLKPLTQQMRSTKTVENILALRGHGTTGLSEALLEARRQLDRSSARRRVVVLLSDCRATDEVDAVPAARALDELVILAPSGDDDEARRLARESGSRVASISSVLEVPAVLGRMLADDAAAR